MDPVVGQPTVQQQQIAGAGSAANPWAEYGLNPDGTPVVQQEPKAPDKTATLEAKVAQLESMLAKLPESFKGMNDKLAIVDKFAAALRGDQADAPAEFPRIWQDLKSVAKTQAPGVAKLLDVLESDPGYLERLQNANQALLAQHIVGMNEKAHGRVLELAKKAGFKGSTDSELSEMVFPFEQSMTMMINANAEMRRAFLSGNLEVIDQVFTQMIKPHVAQRLRDKQARTKPSTLPVAPPKGGGGTGGGGTEDKVKRDLSTPQGRSAFHQQAVSRWLDRRSGNDDV